ncbi:MAG: hypothetical protein HYX41_06580 [Bdellovibrio sp.]|nr:hypothetical protein [Bdellovibrio sp.]
MKITRSFLIRTGIFFSLFAGIGLFMGCDKASVKVPQNTRNFRVATKNIKNVVFLIFENTNYSDAIKQPAFKRLSEEGALLTNYYALTHPSQPNYVALISGSFHGATSDHRYDIDAKHLGDLLQAKGKDWKVYAEDYPGGCFLKMTDGYYARRHVPFLNFKSVQINKEQCAKVVNADQFNSDLATGRLPEFSLYIPNNMNNGHDSGIAFADSYLESQWKDRKDALLSKDILWVVTFDEDSHGEKNRVLTVFYGAGVRAGSKSTQKYDHYSLLKTFEEIFSLSSFGLGDSTAKVIEDIWVEPTEL